MDRGRPLPSPWRARFARTFRVLPMPGAGNCQFEAISRALSMSGDHVTALAVRRLLARAPSDEACETALGVYRALETPAWLSLAPDVPSFRRVLASASPVHFQGDDWSLGVLSAELKIKFVVIRSDGAIQRGLVDAAEDDLCAILFFSDFSEGARPDGATAGHYDLVVDTDGDVALFRGSTLNAVEGVRFTPPPAAKAAETHKGDKAAPPAAKAAETHKSGKAAPPAAKVALAPADGEPLRGVPPGTRRLWVETSRDDAEIEIRSNDNGGLEASIKRVDPLLEEVEYLPVQAHSFDVLMAAVASELTSEGQRVTRVTIE